MLSTTATLTSTREGAPPHRLAGPTYWDKLKEVDRLASINAHKFRKFGKKIGWFPAGVVLEKWTREIYPTITKIFNDAGNYERILGKHNKGVTRPCWLYMVGEGQQWVTARPTIVAICSKTGIAQRICYLLQNIECMRSLNLGFDYMHYKEKSVLVTGDGDPSSSKLFGNLCGLQVLASTYPASMSAKWKQTTAGGTLKINGEYYCLSVAHAFHLDASFAHDGGSDFSSDSDDDSDEPTDIYSDSDPKSSVSVIACGPGVLDNVELGLYFDYGPISTNARAVRNHIPASISADKIRVIGSGRVTSADTPKVRSLLFCAELDWVLIRVKDPHYFRPNLVQAPSKVMLSPQQVSLTPPHGKVLVAAGVSGVFESNCLGIVGGLTLPGSFRIVDVWTIESICLPGDCGSWVIDPITGSIYGMIIATAPEAQESYMIPAYQVYNSIKSKLPRGTTVEFPTPSEAGEVLTVGLPSPTVRRAPSSGVVDRSKKGTLLSQAEVSATEKRSNILECYRFDKRGEDWNVADRQANRSSQAEIKKKLSKNTGNILTEMRAMNSLRKKQIDRLIELRKLFWDMGETAQQVSASILMIQTRKSREKQRDGRKVVEVLSFEIIISIRAPSHRIATIAGSHWLPDGMSDIRSHATGEKKDIDLGRQLALVPLDHGPLEQEPNQPIVRDAEGQIDDPFGEEKLFTVDGKPIYSQDSAEVRPLPASSQQARHGILALGRERPLSSMSEASIRSGPSIGHYPLGRSTPSNLPSRDRGLSSARPIGVFQDERQSKNTLGVDLDELLEEVGERQKSLPRPGQTRIPRGIVGIDMVLQDRGYSFHEEGDMIVIEEDLDEEEINEVIALSKKSFQEMESKRLSSLHKSIETMEVAGPQSALYREPGNITAVSKDSAYHTLSHRAGGEQFITSYGYDSEDSWDDDSDGGYMRNSSSRPRRQRSKSRTERRVHGHAQYARARRPSFTQYREHRRRVASYDADDGISVVRDTRKP